MRGGERERERERERQTCGEVERRFETDRKPERGGLTCAVSCAVLHFLL